jgi:hypothetical protein
VIQKVSRLGLWVSIIVILLLVAVQGWSGGWCAFYLIWPGSNAGATFLHIVAWLTAYHRKLGFAIGGISVLIIVFAFLSKASIYVRVLAVLGLAVTVSAALGGYLYVHSSLQDRLSLGQMADSFIGVFAAYFLQLFFMNKTPRFPWTRARAG